MRPTTAVLAGFLTAVASTVAMAEEPLEQGEYLFRAGGCASCHTDVASKGQPLAGGRALETPFGRFYGPNITPHREFGIGAWSDDDFIRAMREGTAPDGANYFPVFPYPSFTGMTDRDLLRIKAYIFSLPPVAKPNLPHEIRFPFGWRPPLAIWKLLNFTPGPYRADPAATSELNRGAYLVEAVTHCGECHTPRDFMGALDRSMAMAGISEGPEGKPVPNITPDPETGIGNWNVGDLAFFLKIGIDPDGDVAGGLMGEVIDRSTSHLTDEDRRAIATYLHALPPVRNKILRKKGASAQ